VIAGNPTRFGLEFQIGKAFEDRRWFASGCFRVHLSGQCYGRGGRDSTTLSAALDDIENRLATPGERSCVLSETPDPLALALAFIQATYKESQSASFLGLSRDRFVRMLVDRNILLAGNDDPTWDDGSVVFQFDNAQLVRLIAFRRARQSGGPLVTDLVDLSLPANEFYSVLADWRNAIVAAWLRRLKVP
jgi:hypothetical protein